MPEEVDHIVILGSTLTALALARHCRSLSLDCDVVDRRAGPAAASAIPNITLLPELSEQQEVDAVAGLARPGRSALIADSDAWLRWMVKFRKDLDSMFAMILHPSSEVATICLDKSRFLEWCLECQLPAPRLIAKPGRGNVGDVSYPIMVRPRETRHGLPSNLPKAAEVRSGRDFEKLLDQYELEGVEPTICDSLLRSSIRQFSVGLARNSYGDVRAIVAEKTRPPADWCAGGTYVVAVHTEDVHQLAISAANKLDLFGIAEVEILKDEDTQELFLIEVNPRPWVQYSLAWKSGFDFLTFLLAPQKYRPDNETRSGRRWICFGDDLYVALSKSRGMVRKKRMGLWQYFSDLLRANVFAYWSISDIQPWFRKVTERFNRARRQRVVVPK